MFNFLLWILTIVYYAATFSTKYVTRFHITRLPHTQNQTYTILPEMDCWSNTHCTLTSLVSVAAFFRPCQSHECEIGTIKWPWLCDNGV